MLIFLSLSLIVLIYYSFRIFRKARSEKSFNKLMDKSDFDAIATKSDLISFRHEFGETIFELQREIEEIKKYIGDVHK